MKHFLGFFLMLYVSTISTVVYGAADLRVFKLWQTQDWKEATRVAQVYAQKNPTDTQAEFVYSVALMFNNNLVQARTVLTRLIAQHSNVTSLHNNMGVLYLAEGKLLEARKSLNMALALDSRHNNAKKNLILLNNLNEKNGSVSVDHAYVDKRGIEFLNFPTTAAVPAAVVLNHNVSSPIREAERKGNVSFSGGISTAKEKVAVSERENNPFNEDVKRQVFDALNMWVTSWAKKDVEKYFSMYSPDFEPGNGRTRAQWESQRRLRISNKAPIRIDAVDVLLEVGSSTAVVATFEQHYRADALNEISNKMLVFIRDSEKSNQWLIVDERTSY